MSKALNRRDFIKLLSILPPAIYLPASLSQQNPSDVGKGPNIIVLVFDTWSAKNISLYGFPRKTTPNLDRLAENAIIYHNHYAGGHYTVPGTATLLTGVHPWSHNLFAHRFKLNKEYYTQNLFGTFPDYHRLAYTHNTLADEILLYMEKQMESHKNYRDLYLTRDPIAKIFRQDYDTAFVGWVRTMETLDDGYANSVFFSRIWSYLQEKFEKKMLDEFPLGLPKFRETNYFLLEEAIDWLANASATLENPSLIYYHLLPPHMPYNTRKEFVNAFESDGYSPPRKPEHFMSEGHNYKKLTTNRQKYNEYILYVDAEIGRLFSLLKSNGALDNTIIILTSDHGEIFERGMIAHGMPSMYDPLVNIPLLIFAPNQPERVDIYSPTSAVDVLPTLLSITGKEIPSWIEGEVLPPFNQSYSPTRSVYTLDAKLSQVNEPYTNASIMLVKGDYKLIYHYGSRKYYNKLADNQSLELYNLSEDPEEMNNLYKTEPGVGESMLNEILEKLRELDVAP